MRTRSSLSNGSISAGDDDSSAEEAIRRLTEIEDERERRLHIARSLAHLPYDELLTALKDESERYQYIDAHISLRLADDLIAAGENLNRADHRALGMLARGDALRCLGKIEESVETLNASGDAFLAYGDELGWARSRIGWVYSSHLLGHGEAALREGDRAREVLGKHGAWLRAAIIDSNLAIVCYRLGRYQEALTRYDRALGVYASLGEAAEARAAMTQMNKAIVLTYLGDFATALRLHEESRRIYLRHGETIMALRSEHNIGQVYWAQGHYTRALQCYGKAYAAFDEASLEIDSAWVALEMMDCYFRLNRIPEMLELGEETIARFERCGTPTETARARSLCALAYMRVGEHERALSLLNEAERAFNSPFHIAQTVLRRAALRLNGGSWAAAQREAERAHHLFADLGLFVEQTEADFLHARASLRAGDYEMAARLAHDGLITAEDRDVRWLVHEGYHILGKVAERRGDVRGALRSFDEAINNIESVQRYLAVELRANFLADKYEVYQDAIDSCLRLAQPVRAFTYLERAKSRALVDYLATNLEVQIRTREHTSQALLDTLARLREEHNLFQNQLYGHNLTQPIETRAGGDEEARLREAIRDREKRIARILERVALDRSEGLTIPTSSDIDELFAPPTLVPGTVLVEYYVGDREGAIFVVSAGGLSVIPLTVTSGEIRQWLSKWRLILAGTAQALLGGRSVDALARHARAHLAALYHRLIGPVEGVLDGCERLLVIPYGPTHAIPFHALFDGERYLLERVEMAYCPSSSLLRLCSSRPRRPERSALVMAYTDGGQLPAALSEAQAVANLLPGTSFLEEKATRGALMTSAPGHSIIHLAAHGDARLDRPEFAHIKLADGQLSMIDVFNLRLPGGLVTLSACETGRGLVTAGDELVGLSRAFLYAGASSIMQSLWRVEDGSTARLMELFYRALCAGESKGAALRQAQNALRCGGYSHPFFWAPFQLIGDYGPL